MEYSNRVLNVLTLSREEAYRLRQDYIGAEHLLLGLIRDGEGRAITLLRELGVSVSKIKKAVEEKLIGIRGIRGTGIISMTNKPMRF